MTTYLQYEGEPIYVQGYAAPYDSLSIPLDCAGGKRELIRPGAFDDVISHPRAALAAQTHHIAAGRFGSIMERTLRIWSNSYGLGFEVGPLIANVRNSIVVDSIVRGGIRGCSWRGTFEATTEKIHGESVQVIHKINRLFHISPVASGAYPDAATWCSHECPYDLPEYLKPLARHWQNNLPAEPAPQIQTATPRSQARPMARRRPAPSRTSDIYPPLPGLSSREVEEAALNESYARQIMKHQEARKFERQREKNRVRRTA